MKPEEKSRAKESCSRGFRRYRKRDALLVRAIVSHGRPQAQLETLRGRGNHVDHAAGGIRTVHGGTRSTQHLDPFTESSGTGYPYCDGRMHVVEALAVEQDEGLLEIRAADGEIGLHTIGSAFLQVERGSSCSRSASELSTSSMTRAGSRVTERSISSMERGS